MKRTSKPRRMGRRILKGSALILAGALVACADGHSAGGRRASGGGGAPASRSPRPLWLDSPPAGCAAGFSGPTLNPGRSIRQARRGALENLAARTLGVQVESELLIEDAAGRPRPLLEVTRQQIDGVMIHSRIVAMGSAPASDVTPGAPGRRVFALACPLNTKTELAPQPGVPEWLLSTPSKNGRVCVLGVGGPTRKSGSQSAAALRDGRSALAEALESHVRSWTLDDGRGLARVRSQTTSTNRAKELAARIEALESEWFDGAGAGPLGMPGVLYGLVCWED